MFLDEGLLFSNLIRDKERYHRTLEADVRSWRSSVSSFVTLSQIYPNLLSGSLATESPSVSSSPAVAAINHRTPQISNDSKCWRIMRKRNTAKHLSLSHTSSGYVGLGSLWRTAMWSATTRLARCRRQMATTRSIDLGSDLLGCRASECHFKKSWDQCQIHQVEDP